MLLRKIKLRCIPLIALVTWILHLAGCTITDNETSIHCVVGIAVAEPENPVPTPAPTPIPEEGGTTIPPITGQEKSVWTCGAILYDKVQKTEISDPDPNQDRPKYVYVSENSLVEAQKEAETAWRRAGRYLNFPSARYQFKGMWCVKGFFSSDVGGQCPVDGGVARPQGWPWESSEEQLKLRYITDEEFQKLQDGDTEFLWKILPTRKLYNVEDPSSANEVYEASGTE